MPDMLDSWKISYQIIHPDTRYLLYMQGSIIT
jgi:hypothetical protein